MSRQEALNTFSEGMIMDLHPMTTPNNTLVNCLNGTIITYNGNEFVLQNDMGNGRVETAYLPSGYIPVGMTEFGGIIYVISFNPLTNKSQIGSFPSPERNISSEEISDQTIILSNLDFGWNNIMAKTLYVQKDLHQITLNPGDKFIVYAGKGNITNNRNKLYDFPKGETLGKVVKLSLATITEEGQVVKLTNLKDYQYANGTYIIPELEKLQGGKPDIDSYRSLVTSPYNIFNSKVSGRLLVIAELVTIDSFNVSLSAEFIGEGDTKNVEISANMEYTSEGDTYLYGVSGTVKDINKQDIQNPVVIYEGNKSMLWAEPNPAIKQQSSLLYTAQNYDTVNRPPRDIEWSLTPSMSYGPINYLMKSGILQLDKIGTGFINLSEWRYYVDNNSIQLSWALQSYSEPGYSVKGVRFIMSTYNNAAVETLVYNVSNKVSYNGSFTDVIPLESEFYKIDDGKILRSNCLYVVTIEVQYSNQDGTISKNNYFNKILYTSDIFNEQYIEGTIFDFSQIIPTLNLKSSVTSSINQTVNPTINPWLGKLESSVSFDNIESLSVQQIIKNLNVNLLLKPFLDNDYSMFKLDDSSVSINTKITNDDNNIQIGEYTILATGNDDLDKEDILEVRSMDWDGTLIDRPTDQASLANPPYDNGMRLTNLNNYVNGVNISGATPTINNLNLRIIEHIKAYAANAERQITYSSRLVPLIYDRDTAEGYNLVPVGGSSTDIRFKTLNLYSAHERQGSGKHTKVRLGQFTGPDSGDDPTIRNEYNRNDGKHNAIFHRPPYPEHIAGGDWDITSPIVPAVFTSTGNVQYLEVREQTKNSGWLWDYNGNSYGRTHDGGHSTYYYNAIHTAVLCEDNVYRLINLTARFGHPWNSTNVPTGIDRYRVLFRTNGTSSHGYKSLADCYLGMLMQMYRFDTQAFTQSMYIPVSIFYINRYNIDYNFYVHTIVNNDNNVRILLNNNITINEDLIQTLLGYNNRLLGLSDNTTINYNNITFNFINNSNTSTVTYTSTNSGIELRNIISEYERTSYPTWIYKNDGTSLRSTVSLNPSEVYYINSNDIPTRLDSNFKLKGISGYDIQNESSYTINVNNNDNISGNQNFTGVFSIKDGKLNMSSTRLPPVENIRRNGDTGDDGWLLSWSRFTPIQFLAPWTK